MQSRVEWFGHLLNSKRGVAVGGKMGLGTGWGREDGGGPHLLQSSNGTVIEQVVVPMVNPPRRTHIRRPIRPTTIRFHENSPAIWPTRFTVHDNSRRRYQIHRLVATRLASHLTLAIVFSISSVYSIFFFFFSFKSWVVCPYARYSFEKLIFIFSLCERLRTYRNDVRKSSVCLVCSK